MNRFVKGFVIFALALLLVAAGLVAAVYWGFFDLSRFQGTEETAPPPKALARDDNIKEKSNMTTLTIPGIKAEVRYTGEGVAHIRQQIALVEPTARFRGYAYAANFAGVKITGVGASGEAGILSYSHEGLLVSINTDVPSDGFSIEYTVKLGSDGDILSYVDNMAMLTNFLIIPEVKVNGVPIEVYTSAFGDPFIYNMYNYDVSVEVPSEYEVYAPGRVSESGAGGGWKKVSFSASNMRDFPVVICRGAEVVTEDVGGTTVYYIDAAGCSAFVKYGFEFAENNIGFYPYKELFVVKAPIRKNKGMEFSCMVFIADSCFGELETLKSVTYHELMHQWFFGVIGTNQLDEPFLDEGFATFLDGYLRNKSFGRVYNRTFTEKGLSDYDGKTQYSALAYTQSAAYIEEIYRSMGEERFFSMLKALFDDKGFQILTFSEFKGYVNRFSGG